LSEHCVKLLARQSFSSKERAQRVHQEQLDTNEFGEEVAIKGTDTMEPWPSQYLIACPIGHSFPRFPRVCLKI
jgi:hypothetical protein